MPSILQRDAGSRAGPNGAVPALNKAPSDFLSVGPSLFSPLTPLGPPNTVGVFPTQGSAAVGSTPPPHPHLPDSWLLLVLLRATSTGRPL